MRREDLPWNNRSEDDYSTSVYMRKKAKAIWAIAGGKGGTGKSFLSVNMAVALAFSGNKTILIDMDISSPSLNIFTGANAKRDSLDLYYKDKDKRLSDILIETNIENLAIIRGAASINSIPNSNRDLLRLYTDLQYLDADNIILDLGAGSHNLTTDYFNFANKNLLVLNPNPQSVLSTYFFLRQSLFNKISFLAKNSLKDGSLIKDLEKYFNDENISPLELVEVCSKQSKELGSILLDYLFKYKPCVILNKISSQSDKIFFNKLKDTIQNYLNLSVELTAEFKFDNKVEKSLKEEIPYLIKYTDKELSTKILEMSLKLDDKTINLNQKYLKQILKEKQKYTKEKLLN